jgi:hypothetical protein
MEAPKAKRAIFFKRGRRFVGAMTFDAESGPIADSNP